MLAFYIAVFLMVLAALLIPTILIVTAPSTACYTDAVFTTLSSSPVEIGQLAADTDNGLLYGQALGNRAFFQYDPSIDHWSTLTSTPTPFSYSTGLAYLDGKVYSMVTPDSSTFPYLYVYDVAGHNWSSITNPMGTTQAMMAGYRGLLYLAADTNRFLAYDPVAVATHTLTNVPFNGGGNTIIVPFLNSIIASAESNDSQAGLMKYHIASNSWSTITTVNPWGVPAMDLAVIDTDHGVFVGNDTANDMTLYDFNCATWTAQVQLPGIDDTDAWAYLPKPYAQNGIYITMFPNILYRANLTK